MPDQTATAEMRKPEEDTAKERVIEIAPKAPTPKTPAPKAPTIDQVSLAEAKKPRHLLQSLSRLRPLLPIVAGGLRMVDHVALRGLGQLINLASGTGAAAFDAQEELHHDLSNIQTSHKELHLQVQDQAVELRRIEDQIKRLREATERNAAVHAELAGDVQSLSRLVRVIGIGLGVLLVVLIALAALLLAHHA